ncbi:MAG: hypothetical protein HOP19_01580 [Acidobacteria bacterium]|nr:hypothetical protein [Acidobacteriota bacterium]
MKRIIGCVIALLFAPLFIAEAQQQPTRVPLPIVPLLIEYEYAPLYLMQFLTGHARYTQIEAVISKSDAQVILVEKDGRRVWYANTEAKVKALTQAGREAHLAAIDYQAIAGEAGRQTHGVALRDKHGQVIRWRFIPASEPSERGAGLTPLGNVPGVRLNYRDLGTLAGAGTAVQFDNQLIEAEPWPERSSPPYFSGYRGSLTLGLHSGTIALGREEWRVTLKPDSLREGAEWKLTNQFGRERRWRVTALRGDEVTMTESDGTLTLNARVAAEGLALRALQFGQGKQMMRIAFSPELDFASGGKPTVTFQIDQSNQQKLAHGTVSVEKQGGGVSLRWQVKAPDWAKGKTFETLVTTLPDGYAVVAR